jgi:membrane-associated phospholipid phosphatase
VSTGATSRVLGLPLDRLFALYLAVAALALLFPFRPPAWPWLLAMHVLAFAALWPLAPLERVLQRAAPRLRAAVRNIADWAPLLLIPVLYTELAILNRAVHGGSYFDDLIIRWEQLLFGGQPSREWAAAAPHLWLSEVLHFAYLSYYFIIFVPPLLLWIRGRRSEFRLCVFALMLSFFAHYVFFIFFPVQGPRYLYPAPGGEIAGGFFYQSAHRLLEAGSSQGAAFPSSHVGVSVTQTLIVLRFLPRLAVIIGLLTAGLAAGAIYGGFHYAIDALAGLLLGILVFLAASPLYAALGRMREASRPDPRNAPAQ